MTPEIFSYIGCTFLGALIVALVQKVFESKKATVEKGASDCSDVRVVHGEHLAVILSKLDGIIKRLDTFESEAFGRLRRLEDKVSAHGAILKFREPETDAYHQNELRKHA
jgi:hypothetical protein